MHRACLANPVASIHSLQIHLRILEGKTKVYCIRTIMSNGMYIQQITGRTATYFLIRLFSIYGYYGQWIIRENYPVAVIEDTGISRSKVDAKSTSPRAQEEDIHTAIQVIEFCYQP